MTDSFLFSRIAVIESQIVAYDTAIAAISSGVESYRIDTGQTVQNVTRANLDELNRVVLSLYSQRDVLRSRCGIDPGVVTARPGY